MSIFSDIIGFFENLGGTKDDIVSNLGLDGLADTATTIKDDVATKVTDAAQGATDAKDAAVGNVTDAVNGGLDKNK